MKTVKTPKGTELQVMSLKGKDYLQVQQRLIWFVEENPRYDITTDFVKLDDEMAIARCTISILEDTAEGVRVVKKVTDYKTESAKSFPDFVEKAATGACGRALALLSYGTQFAADLDEGDRIVDSPVAAKTNTSVKPVTETVKSATTEAVTNATQDVKTMPMAIPSTAAKANKFARSKPNTGSL